MNLFRLARTAGILSLVASGLTGCLSPPSYPSTPSIEFESIRRQRFTTAGSSLPIDSVYVTISFQDGDGDLGLTEAEAKVVPYSTTYYGANFFATPFVKNTVTGKYDSLKTVRTYLTKSYLYDRFAHLSSTTDSKASPLKGTLTRAYGFVYGSPFLPNDEIKFTVSIFDRALHQSNTIETETITIPPK